MSALLFSLPLFGFLAGAEPRMKFEVSLGLLRLLARRWDPTCWVGLEPLQLVPISHLTPAHTGLGLLPTKGDFAFLWGQARTQRAFCIQKQRGRARNCNVAEVMLSWRCRVLRIGACGWARCGASLSWGARPLCPAPRACPAGRCGDFGSSSDKLFVAEQLWLCTMARSRWLSENTRWKLCVMPPLPQGTINIG